MKIIVEQKPEQEETQIVITCQTADAGVRRIVSALHALDLRLTGEVDGKTHLIGLQDVLYFESVDRHTFMYTQNQVLKTELKLYELAGLAQNHFFRISKSAVVNIQKIKALRPEFGGRIELMLLNGEKLLVSRQYARELKTKLEI